MNGTTTIQTEKLNGHKIDNSSNSGISKYLNGFAIETAGSIKTEAQRLNQQMGQLSNRAAKLNSEDYIGLSDIQGEMADLVLHSTKIIGMLAETVKGELQ